jgi:nitroimidazol reductase NimA-like FMN-containing flavoprotein (pyridoxamine 5'-phosphate oxidase superfamily)
MKTVSPFLKFLRRGFGMRDYAMRRKDRAITDRAWMEGILNCGQVVHIAMTDAEGGPYLVAMGYGFKDGVIFLHGAPEGRKNDILSVNPRVCFHVATDVVVLREKNSMRYRSVTGFGRISTINDPVEKNAALKILTDHYDGAHRDLDGKGLARVWVARLDIESMTGKCANYDDAEKGMEA